MTFAFNETNREYGMWVNCTMQDESMFNGHSNPTVTIDVGLLGEYIERFPYNINPAERVMVYCNEEDGTVTEVFSAAISEIAEEYS